MQRLPRASGDKHVAAFKRVGFMVNHIRFKILKTTKTRSYMVISWA